MDLSQYSDNAISKSEEYKSVTQHAQSVSSRFKNPDEYHHQLNKGESLPSRLFCSIYSPNRLGNLTITYTRRLICPSFNQTHESPM
jgi:hypothetical protein